MFVYDLLERLIGNLEYQGDVNYEETVVERLNGDFDDILRYVAFHLVNCLSAGDGITSSSQSIRETALNLVETYIVEIISQPGVLNKLGYENLKKLDI